MPFFNFAGWLRSKYYPRTGTFRKRKPASVRLSAETLEDRTVPSSLPTPIVSNPTVMPSPAPPTGSQPLIDAKVVIDPTDPQKLVAVASFDPATPNTTTNIPGVRYWYSTNAGTTWSAAVPLDNLRDPADFSNPQIYLAQNEDANVGFDRLHNFFITSKQHNGANTSGAITVDKFNFSGAAPTRVDSDPTTGGVNSYILYRWLNQDPAFNPVIGIDTNEPTYTDPETGAIQTDTMANHLSSGTPGSVNSLTLTSGGSGYATPPTVSIVGGGGSGATGTTTINGVVSSVNVTNGGSGYTSAPTVTFAGGGGGTGATATATFGLLTDIVVTSGGTGYTSPPTVTITGGGGAGGTAVANLTGGVVTSVTLTNFGASYTTAPTVTFTGGGGGGAAAIANFSSAVASITVTNGGTGYTATPTVTISGGGGGGATGTAVLDAVVTSITLTNGGSGYISTPNVLLVGGGGGFGATATAQLANPAPKAIYVAWSTNFNNPANTNPAIQSRIWTVASADGGKTFSPPVFVSDANVAGAAPQIVFTQGSADGRVRGGEVKFFWLGSNLPATAYNRIFMDSSTPDGGVANAPAVAAQVFTNTQLGNIPDATVPATTPPNNTPASSSGSILSVTVTNGGSGYTSPPAISFFGGGGAGGAATAVISGGVANVTMSNFGTGYTFAPGVVFSGGGGVGATGTANFTNGVSAVTLGGGGSGYTSVPTVTFSAPPPGGTTATGTAVINGVVQNTVVVTNGGNGYFTPPTVTFVGGGGTGATGTAIMTGAVVTGVNVTNGGTGYTSAPLVIFTPTGGGNGAAATASIAAVVTSIIVTDPGSGYLGVPTVTIAAPPVGGTQATATATISGIVRGVTITNPGNGYTTAPTVSFIGGGGAGAAGTAALNGVVTAINLTLPGGGGLGYTFPPTVVFTGGGGTGATAAAVITTAPFIMNVNITDPNFTTVADLDVTLNVRHPNLAHLRIVLIAPNGQSVTLLNNNQRPSDGAAQNGIGVTGANLGVTIGGNNNSITHNIGTVFDDETQRGIRDGGAPFASHFRPEGANGLSQFYGLTKAQVNGPWTLVFTDNIDDGGGVNPTQFLNGWTMTFSSRINNTEFAADSLLPPTTVASSATNVFGQAGTGPFGTPGVSPSLSVAIDNTLGSFSPHQGNIYVGYTTASPTTGVPTNTNIAVITSNNGGLSWGTAVRVNNDSAADGFSEGTRPQFMPTLTVDPITGTLLVMYYDGRYDAARARVATFLATSIDGGQTFENQTFLNRPTQAIDAITGNTITLEPLPGNQGQAGPLGFGDHQGLAAYAGRVYPMFSSNLNVAGAQIHTATVAIAAGPRALFSDMGPIAATSFAADGTPQLTDFRVQFDRPIDISSFTGDDVLLQFRDTVTSTSSPPNLTLTGNAALTVTPLDASIFWGSAVLGGLMATTFLVSLSTPLSGVGTYAYAIGPLVSDKIRRRTLGAVSLSQFASTVIDFSTQFSTTAWAASQATGPPDTLVQGDISTAWSALNPNGPPDPEFITLGYTVPVFANGVTVRENNGIGFVFQVDVLDVNDVYHTVFTGFDPSVPGVNGVDPPVEFQISFPTTPYLVKGVKVYVDPNHDLNTWEEIDSVALHGSLTFTGTFFATGPLDTNLPLPPSGTGGTLGGVVFPTPPANNADTTVSTINISGLTTPITDVNVNVQMTHSFNANLAMRLVAPDGTIVPLAFHRGGSGVDGYFSTTFDDQAATPIASAVAPFTTVRPESPLSVLGGMSAALANGTWTLQVNDDTAGDIGNLIGWSLTLTTSTSGAAGVDGNLMDQNGNAAVGETPFARARDVLVAAGGTGYQVGDVLTVLGGSGLASAKLVVTSVNGGGAVTSVSIQQGGWYTSTPFNPLRVIGGAGTGALFNINWTLITSAGGSGDIFSAPAPTDPAVQLPLALPYDQDTLPIIIPGPHVISTRVPGVPASADNLVLNAVNNAIDVTFDRDIDPTTFTPSNILRIVGPAGYITTYTLGPAVTFTGGGGNGATGVATLSNGAIVGVFMTSPGAGYTSPPTVTFPGGGTGATAVATLGGGGVNGVNITNPGRGYSGTAPQNIPDNGTLISALTVNDSLMVNGLTVGLNISHANLADLTVVLVAPDGTLVQLFDGATGANLTGTSFDDNAIDTIPTANAPYTGVFRPMRQVATAVVALGQGGTGYTVGDILTVQGGTFSTPAQLRVASVGAAGNVTGVVIVRAGGYAIQPANPASVTGGTGTGARFTLTLGNGLSVLTGKNYRGTWRLRVTDNATGVTGTLNGWSLNPVSVTPNPPGGTPNRSFRITIPSQSLSGSYAVTVGPDAFGNYVKDNNLKSVALASGGSGYTIHDVLTVQGGTFTSPAELRVTSVGAFVAGTSINTGGSGYTVNDLLTVLGGTFSTPAQLRVTSTAGGVITGFTVVQQGTYTVTPLGPVSVFGGTGTGAVFNVPFTAITGVTFSRPGTYTARPSNPASVTGGTGTGATFTLTFGNEVDMNLNAGVDVLRGGDPNNGTVLPSNFASGPVNQALPHSRTTDATINVPASFLVQNVTVQLSIQHQNIPDLVADLIAPDGTTVRLFTGVGNTGSTPHANFTNTTLDDLAAAPIQSAPTQPGIGIGAGPFTPQLPLSTFKNHGSQGDWTLRLQSNSSTLDGTLVSWNLTLRSSVPGSGLGESISDQFSPHFRIFTQDPTNAVSQQSWTPVGPASIQNGFGSGRIGGLAVDPSDPSGNTVYMSGASGGVWKTTNFLDPNQQPTWVPLTDLGPGFAVNTGSIAIFGRNNDPNQSIIFVATGEGDVGTPGAGFLRSMDGGRTWKVLDSTSNSDLAGNILPISDIGRDRAFVNSSGFKVIVDPKPTPTGEVIVYAALVGTNAGIWRSVDTGKHWTQIRAGNATDVVLAAGSADANGNLQILYAAFRGVGVFYMTNAPTALTMSLRNGGTGVPLRRDLDPLVDTEVQILNLGTNPNVPTSRVLLATPALTGNALHDSVYQGWLYVVNVTGGGTFEGLYLTKDFGLNWTKLRLPTRGTGFNRIPSNDDSIAVDYDVFSSATTSQGTYDVSFAIDPNNPAVVFLGGLGGADGSNGMPFGLIRIDTTTSFDSHALVRYDNSNADGGALQNATLGGITIKPTPTPGQAGILGAIGTGNPFGLVTHPNTSYYNLLRDPDNPFLANASLQFGNVLNFTNNGQNTRWNGYESGVVGGDQHELLAIRDPLTGHTRLIGGDDHAIYTGTARDDGSETTGIGTAEAVIGSRNGNLQITQFYYGAAQPSTLAADLAGALFYGMAQDDGFPDADPHLLDNGNLSWGVGTSPAAARGDGAGVATDQTGSGSYYQYRWPCCINDGTLASDFFKFFSPSTGYLSRTTGLLQAGDNPAGGTGQWPETGTINFAVNPIDPTAIVISSRAGRVFLTSGPSTGTGKQWFPIADPGDVGGAQSFAMAFGAPANATAPLSDFIYVGTASGQMFVTTVGGGVGGGAAVWRNISAGLAGGTVMSVVTNPTRGSREAFAVTLGGGVFWMADSTAVGATWVPITGNLFAPTLTRSMYNDPAEQFATLKSLHAIQADWRYAIPDNLAAPLGPKHPVLYVGGEGGVFRSLDKGVTWTYFPDMTIDGARQAGGFLPTGLIRDLDFSLGNINPLNGMPDETFGRNLLVATTYGRGTFAIRLNDGIRLANGNPLSTYAVSPVTGPHVVSIAPAPASSSNSQFADSVINFSSQQSGTSSSASQVLGTPDTFTYAHSTTAWAPSAQNGTTEHITVGFAIPVNANGVTIYETYGNGFVTQVELLDTNDVFHTVFLSPTDTDTAVPGFADQLFIGFPTTPYLVKGVRITTNTNHDLTASEEIDAVQLHSPTALLQTPAIRVTFSGPIDPASFSTADIQSVVGPAGNVLPIRRVQVVGFNSFDVFLTTPQSQPGFYRVTLGPNVSDFSGYRMDQNQDFINGQNPQDVYTGRFLFQPFPNFAPVLAPSVTAPSIAAFPPIVEDNLTNTGSDLPSFLAGLPAGAFSDPNDASYAPLNAPRGIAIYNADNTNGSWQYSVNGGATWQPMGAFTQTNALLLEITANNRIRFVPNPNYSSDTPPSPSVAFRAWDLTAGLLPLTGADGGTADASTNGTATAFSAQSGLVVITVTPVNDQPFFIKGANQTVPEDSGPQTVTGWATSVLAFPPPPAPPAPDELTQVLTFLVTTNNPSLFATGPVIAANGTLTYTPAANTAGVATVTVTLQDSGGTANGGIDSFGPQTFTITVLPNNDPPTFTLGPSPTVLEDAGPQTFDPWATNVVPGPPDEVAAGQTLTFTVTNDNNALFLVQPSLTPAGVLTFTTNPNANGSALVTVTATDDGGIANGGVDTSAPQTFTITVTAVNDAPSFVKGANQTSLEDAGAQSTSSWATSISAGPPDETGQTVSFTVTNDNNSLFAVQPTIAANGTLTYTAAPHANGTATVTVVAKDNGGIANGGSDSSAAQTFTITVTPVNDVPSFTKGGDQIVLEDAGAQSFNWATNILAYPAAPAPLATNEGGQLLDFLVSTDKPALFAAGPAISATGILTFTTAPNANGTATVTVRLHDNGGTTNGGVDTSAPQTFTITVTAVNDPPSYTRGPDPLVVNEDSGPHSSIWATGIVPGPADERSPIGSQTVTSITLTNNATHLFAAQPTMSLAGLLEFTPAANANGIAIVTITAKDDGGTLNGGNDTSVQTFVISITAVNDAPSFTKGADQTVFEDAGPQTVANWATNQIPSSPPPPGLADEAGQALDFIVTTSNDALFSALPAITPGGNLSYTTALNAVGTATVTVRLHDNGGTANGGVDTSAPQTFTITVNAVNDPPSLTKGPDISIPEDSGPQTVNNWASNIVAGPPDEVAAGQIVTIAVTNNNNALFAVQPSLSTTGTLTYQTAANAVGTATVSIVLSDDGGTANGGIDTSLPQTFTITVTGVNDAPVNALPGAAQSTAEDTAKVFSTGTGNAISISDLDDADNGTPGDQPVQVSLSVAHGTLTLSSLAGLVFGPGDGIADANMTFTGTLDDVNAALNGLSYTPAANYHGPDTLNIVTSDLGNFGTPGALGDSDALPITVTAVNDAPENTVPGAQTTLEDTSKTFSTGNGNRIAIADVDDADDGTPGNENVQVTLAVTHGTLTLSGTAGLSFLPGSDGVADASMTFSGTLDQINAALSGLVYAPARNFNGPDSLSITTDDQGNFGAPGPRNDADSVPISVTPVNDVPSFTKGGDQSVLEDSGPHSLAGWATAILAYPAAPPPLAVDEAGQGLTFLVTSSNPSLFAAGPAIAANGTLTYTLAPHANGTALITVRLMDDGGTDNGGGDTSAPQTFTVNVAPVNDAPSFVKGPNQAHLEDAGAQSFPGWATGMSVGPADEVLAGQLVSFTVTNDNNAMFAVQPAVSSAGTLTYTLAPNANGIANVSVVAKDNGGSANGGADASAPQILTINVTAVNDRPSFLKGPDQTIPENSPAQTVTNWAGAILPYPAAPAVPATDELGQAMNFIVTNNNAGLFSVPPAIGPTGILTYTPATNANGTALVTVQLHDSGGTTNGGADTSAAQTFNINITTATTTALAFSANPAVIGQALTISAIVTPNSGSPVVPTGTVTFVDTTTGTTLGTNITLDAVGRAAIAVNNLARGTHAITATYSGDTRYTASNDTEVESINAADTNVALSSSLPTSIFTQSVTITAVVNVTSPGSAANVAPVGTVTFVDITTSTNLGTIALVGNQASITTSDLAAGNHAIQATFNSTSNNFNSSPAASFTQVVKPHPVTFMFVPGSIMTGTAFTVVVNYMKDGAPDASYNGPISLAVNSGPGNLFGNTAVNAVNGVAVLTGLAFDRAGAYTLSAQAPGLAAVLSAPIQATALSLVASLPRAFVGKFIPVNLAALDATGNLAGNFNGPFTLVVRARPAGAAVTGRVGTFAGGAASLPALKVNKAGRYTFQVTVNGLSLTFRMNVVFGRRRGPLPRR